MAVGAADARDAPGEMAERMALDGGHGGAVRRARGRAWGWRPLFLAAFAALALREALCS